MIERNKAFLSEQTEKLFILGCVPLANMGKNQTCDSLQKYF